MNTAQLTPAEIQDFQNRLNLILRSNLQSCRTGITFSDSLADLDLINPNFTERWMSIQTNATYLINNFSILDLNRDADNIRRFLGFWTASPYAFETWICIVTECLTMLFNRLYVTPKYIYIPNRMARNLESYERMARIIRGDPLFSNSIMSKIEQMISNPLDIIESCISTESRPANLNPNWLTNSFIAIVSPTMTGKTQLAFVLEQVKPLYFPCTGRSDNVSQGIYLNFSSLTSTISNLIFADLMELRTLFPDDVRDIGPNSAKWTFRNNVPRMLYSQIKAQNIRHIYHGFKFRALGFLVKAAQRATSNFETSDLSWMRYWGTQGSFEFNAMSLDEFDELFPLGSNPFEEYCLYLDEYVGFVEFVLLRNLARAIKLRCIVSNTNSDISNLLGRFQANVGRVTGNIVWSMVVTNLGNMSTYAFEQFYSQDLNEFAQSVAPRCSALDREAFIEFLVSLNTRTDLMRPGVFKIYFESLNAFRTRFRETFSFCNFLDFVVNFIGKAILEHKISISDSLEGRLANLSLILGNGYTDLSLSEHDTAFNNSKMFLKAHLYQLINPVNAAEWLFITFPMYTGTLVAEDNDDDLKICINGDLFVWHRSFTQFHEHELLTALACTSISLRHSIAKCMAEGRIQSRVGVIDLGCAAVNPDAIKRDGNFLEVLTTIAAIDASRHVCNHDGVTFGGVNGLDFMTSFIRNLVDENGSQMSRPFPFHISFARQSEQSFDLELFLANSKVPYLMPSGRTVPAILQRLQEINAINVGECSRLPDADQLDIGFDFGADLTNFTSRNSVLVQHEAVAECKNWNAAVNATILKSIISKAFKHGAKVCLISCLKISDPRISLRSFCASKLVNLYKVTLIDANLKTYSVSPFQNTISYGAPKMICIIFEIAVIHPGSFLVRTQAENVPEPSRGTNQRSARRTLPVRRTRETTKHSRKATKPRK